MSKKSIQGVSVFSVTPIDSDEQIDFAAWNRHLDRMVAAGVHSITLFGSTGSNGYFTEAEKIAALDNALTHVAGRVPVMFGIGAMTTGESIRLAQHAAKAGADAVLAVPINYWPPTVRELTAHYKAISDATDIPIWLYNNPGLVGLDMVPATIAQIAAAAKNVVGMKDSSGDLSRTIRVPLLTNGQVAVGVGQDTMTLEAALGPSPGWFTGLANIAPAQCAAFWKAAKSGDATSAYATAKTLFAMAELGGRLGIVRVAHEGLELQGLSMGKTRRPMLPLQREDRAELKAAMQTAGLI
jgi:4-hydroxy-tetrahydrodipicolinate synthase